MNKVIYIRADGGPGIGLGHIIRCFALAQMLNEDFDIYFFSKEIPESIADDIRGIGFRVELISTEEEFISRLKGNEIVVLDHYGLDSEYQMKVKEAGCKLVCIDDLHEKEFYADLIINHSPGVVSEEYNAQPYTKLSLGLNYALLRPAFLEAARNSEIEFSTNPNLFICFGGGDEHNLTKTSLEVAVTFSEFNNIYPVLGPSFQNYKEIEVLAKKDKRIEIKRNLGERELLKLMQLCDLAIIPASGILLETLAAGCKVITGKYVENQKKNFNYFKNSELISDAGDFSVKAIQNAIQKSLNSKYLNNSFIDGKSGGRIKKLFLGLATTLRNFTEKDCEVLFNLANDPDVRSNAFNTSTISWEQHKEWFSKKLENSDTKIYILEWEKSPVGQIRFERVENYWKIDYSIDREHRGKGLGTVLLEKSLERINGSFKAWVKKENTGSNRVFEKSGFKRVLSGKVNEFEFHSANPKI